MDNGTFKENLKNLKVYLKDKPKVFWDADEWTSPLILEKQVEGLDVALKGHTCSAFEFEDALTSNGSVVFLCDYKPEWFQTFKAKIFKMHAKILLH